MNYRLSSSFVEALIKSANMLAQRRKDNMSLGFPLTKEQVQLALIQPKLRDPYAQIRAAGGRLIMSSIIMFDIGEPEWKLTIKNPGPGFDVLNDRHVNYSPYREIGPFYAEGLTVDEVSAFQSWVRIATLEAKLYDLTKKVVDEFLYYKYDDKHEKLLLSVGHIMARWPTLKILVDETKDSTWIRRFNEPPVNLKRYRWRSDWAGDPAWLKKWGKSMKVADMVLTSASLMPDVQRKPTDLVAAVVTVKG